MNLGVVSLAMLCHPTGGELRSTVEAAEAAWLTPEEAVAAALEARAVRITDAVREDGPFVRVHDGTSLLTAP
jgi:8-oxo-dGTP diphosphatase